MDSNGKLNIKNAVNKLNLVKLNLVKRITESAIGLEGKAMDQYDKAMDIHDKHFKGAKAVRESKIQELAELKQRRGKALDTLEDIKDLSERHKKEKEIYDYYKLQINIIEDELKDCDKEKMRGSGEIRDKALDGLKKATIVVVAAAAGVYGAKKFIEHSEDESELGYIGEPDDNTEESDDEIYNPYDEADDEI
ncbi:hypothetical protein [Clostridium cylindrosporum]|uniref:Uncharacterized protein n=1 Tax=Clostridium cylindrosporum DSM 605 TaxID=1121307 RepID=A0A0J8DDJ9_CLOCY|nr:hypothetical protein [Clostridium cylindrosporum]KMT22309.1 hypothetical protein CLCY_17c00030 [Clostridium cylindrosporum DSM 605]